MRRKYILALAGVAVIVATFFAGVASDAGFLVALKVVGVTFFPMAIAFWIGWILAGD